MQQTKLKKQKKLQNNKIIINSINIENHVSQLPTSEKYVNLELALPVQTPLETDYIKMFK